MRKATMRMAAVVLAGMASSGAALAADWHYEGGAVPIAWSESTGAAGEGGAQLQFACRGGDLTLGYWVRAPEGDVAKAATLSVALTPDPPGGKTIFAQNMPMIHADGSSVIVRGPVARQWAGIAQRARAEMRVAYARPGSTGVEYLDAHVFGAAGSNAAIGKVLERCG